MFATSSPIGRSKPFSAPHVESGKTVASTTYLRPIQTRQPTPHKAAVFALPQEPEDARITGGTRSLDRRLLALNLAGTRPRLVESRSAFPGVQPTAA